MPDNETTGLRRASDILPSIAVADAIFDEVIRPEDIGYTHPVFLQCFLPTRHSAENRQRWQTNCGRASLVIRAGELVNPEKPNEFEACIVPAGPKARFVVAYVNDYIQRHNTPTVNLGDSLRAAMRHMNIAIGGRNGQELTREIKNFAAAEIGIGLWDPNGRVEHRRALVAPSMSFWLEKESDQRTIWQPEMTVSREYFASVHDPDRMAPFYWPALVGLQHDTRAMDIFCFLTYRLHKGLKRPVILSVGALHTMFGTDVKEPKHFWSSFKKSLLAALRWYPKAQVEIKNDCIILKNSPPLIPYRKIHRLGQ